MCKGESYKSKAEKNTNIYIFMCVHKIRLCILYRGISSHSSVNGAQYTEIENNVIFLAAHNTEIE